MRLKDVDYLELPASADMHVHLRQGAMMELVVPEIRRGGVDTVFVMVREAGHYSFQIIFLPYAAQSSTTYHDGCSSGWVSVPLAIYRAER